MPVWKQLHVFPHQALGLPQYTGACVYPSVPGAAAIQSCMCLPISPWDCRNTQGDASSLGLTWSNTEPHPLRSQPPRHDSIRKHSSCEHQDGFSPLLPLLYLRVGHGAQASNASTRDTVLLSWDRTNELPHCLHTFHTHFQYITHILATHHIHTYPRFVVQDCEKIHCIVTVLPLQRASIRRRAEGNVSAYR
jgi:hypothetical protein